MTVTVELSPMEAALVMIHAKEQWYGRDSMLVDLEREHWATIYRKLLKAIDSSDKPVRQ